MRNTSVAGSPRNLDVSCAATCRLFTALVDAIPANIPPWYIAGTYPRTSWTDYLLSPPDALCEDDLCRSIRCISVLLPASDGGQFNTVACVLAFGELRLLSIRAISVPLCLPGMGCDPYSFPAAFYFLPGCVCLGIPSQATLLWAFLVSHSIPSTACCATSTLSAKACISDLLLYLHGLERRRLR